MPRSLYPVKRRDHQLISKTEHTHTHTHKHTHTPEFIWIFGGLGRGELKHTITDWKDNGSRP